MADTLEKVQEIDPIMDLNYDYKPEEIVFRGPINKNVNEFIAAGPSDTNITFQNIAPNDLTQVIERKFNIGRDQLVAVQFSGTYAGFGGTFLPYPFPYAVVASDFVGTQALGNAGSKAWPAAGTYYAGQVVTDPYSAGLGGGGVNGLNYTLCLAPLGLQLSCSNGELILNQNSRSINLQQNVLLKPYMMDTDDVNYYASACPCQRDSKANYTANVAYENNSPFCPPTMNTNVQSRGSFVAELISEYVNNSIVYRVYRYKNIVEPLDISPLIVGKSFNSDGFANLTSIAVKLTINNIYKTLSLASSVVLGGTFINAVTTSTVSVQSVNTAGAAITVSLASQQLKLYLNYLDQDALLAARMKDRLYYDYDDVVSDSNTVGLGGSISGTTLFVPRTYTTQSLRVSVNPYKMIFCLTPDPAQMPNNATASQITNTFLRITAMQLKYQNKNLLTGWTEEDLYRTSVKNGLKLSWFDWRYSVGSIVILDVASDLGLPADSAPNMNVQTQVQATITYTNHPLVYSGMTTPVNYTLMTYLISSGKCIISPAKTEYITGGISASEVLELSASGDNEINSVARQTIAKEKGGSLFSKSHGLINKALSLAKKITPAHISAAKDAYDAVKREIGGNVTAGSVVAGKLRKHKRIL